MLGYSSATHTMKPTTLLLVLATLCTLSGCANLAHSYASNHAELSPEHRKILMTGKIPDGTAVAGMTREEVRLAMKKDPNQFTKINGLDAWVYANEKGHSPDLAEEQGHNHEGGSGTGSGSNWFNHEPGHTSSDALGEIADQANLSTTIIFQGDRAIRADVTREQP
jgi:hypothetical protein